MKKTTENSPTQFFPNETGKKLYTGANVFRRFYLKTFGCQMNVADAGEYSRHLQNYGFLPTENLKEAQIVLLNTCTVRQHAEDKVLTLIGSLKRWKEKNPENILIVAGCVAQRIGEHLKKRFPYVDLVVGAKDIDFFPEMLSRLGQFSPLGPFESSHQVTPSSSHQVTGSPGHQVTAFVTIMRGCENFCSYCIVPYVRGKEKSRSVEEIISEIKCLVEQGVKEVTLLGQNVNSYKSEVRSRRSNVQGPRSEVQSPKPEFDFADLLEEVNKIEGLERVRFVTSHPKDLSEKIIYAMRDLDKVCKHLHLPVQAGSNQILEKMNRKYTQEDYLSLVEKIKRTIPEIAITTDIIVGFPGETEEDFQETLDLVQKVEFDSAYTFKYSPRPGTIAEKLEDNLPLKIKEERLQRLNELCNKISKKKNKELVGSVQEVLVEKYTSSKLEGRTRTNKIVFVNREEDLPRVFRQNGVGDNVKKVSCYSLSTQRKVRGLLGKTVNVEITQANPHSLIGNIDYTDF